MKALRALILLVLFFLAASPAWATFTLSQKPSSFFPVYMTFSSSDYNQKPIFIDLDNDGDKDLVVGCNSGALTYYQNTGTASSPAWAIDNNKFTGVSVSSYAAPAFADLDGDSDYDLIIGDLYGNLKYYRNIGSRTNPSWSYDSSMFSGIDVGSYASPTFADLDNDGDLDMTVGESSTIKYYKNTGTATSPVWTLDATVLSGISPATNNSPRYEDLDNDGDLDLLIAYRGSTIICYKNIGTPSSPSWSWNTSLISGLYPYYSEDNGIAIADLDNDGDRDIIIGASDLIFYLNTGNAATPSWIISNPYIKGFDVGTNSTPTLVDINNDGLKDVFIGNYDGTLYCFLNKGSATSPIWAIVNTQVATIDAGSYSSPAFADLDADGDSDLVIGEYYGNLKYYQNTGSANSPIWTQDNDLFLGIDAGSYSSPTFADLDNDGDMDLVIGESYGGLKYYINTGTSTSPAWSVNTTLFSAIDAGWDSKPAFSDLDGDGDLDLVVGNDWGQLYYYENIGTSAAPSFRYDYSAFSGYYFSSDTAPAFADVDGDGKNELILGNYNGTLACYDMTYRDLTGPTINTPTYQITSTTGRYTLGWNPASDSSGVAAYELQESAGYYGSYSTLSSTIATTSFEVTGKTYGIYYYRVRAKDGAGNWGSYSDICTATVAATTEAELAISASDVTLSSGDRAVESGDMVALNITVHNWGAKDASAILKVYVGTKDSAHLVDAAYIYPSSLSSDSSYLYWYTTGLAGPQNIYVVLESISPSDWDASNNEVLKTVNVVNMFRSTFCYPNPFKPEEGSTRIVYKLTNYGNTHLFIFDINGRIIYRKLYWSGQTGGTLGINEVEWDGASDYGKLVDNGLYIYKILDDTKKVLATGKILVLR